MSITLCGFNDEFIVWIFFFILGTKWAEQTYKNGFTFGILQLRANTILIICLIKLNIFRSLLQFPLNKQHIKNY